MSWLEDAGQHQRIERDEPELPHLIEDAGGALGHQAGEHVSAVERRNRNQVEEREQQVRLDRQPEHRSAADRTSVRLDRAGGDTPARTIACRKLLIGPAAATIMKSRR